MDIKSIYDLVHNRSTSLCEVVGNNGIDIYINDFIQDEDRLLLQMHLIGPVSLLMDIANNTAEVVYTHTQFSFAYAQGGSRDRVMESANVATKIAVANTKWLYPYRFWSNDAPIYVGKKFDVEWGADGFKLHPVCESVVEPFYKKKRTKRDADAVDHLNKVLYGEYVRHYIKEGGFSINQDACLNLFVGALQAVFMKQHDYDSFMERFPANILGRGIHNFPFNDLLSKEVTPQILDALVSYQEEKIFNHDRYTNPNAFIELDNVPRIRYSHMTEVYTNKLNNELHAIAERTGVPPHPLLPAALVMGGRIEFGLHEWNCS